MKQVLCILLLAFSLFSCCKKETSIVHEYVYAGETFAMSEHVETINGITNTVAWDSSYQDKMNLTYNDDFSTITVKVSSQTHPCQTFRETFVFPKNSLNVYTANNDSGNGSHTFEISSDSVYAYMLKVDGSDSIYTSYTLSFKGKLVQ